MLITSSQNTKIKKLRSLFKDKKLRENDGVFVLEGVNLVKDIPSEIVVLELFIKESEYTKLAYLEDKFNLEAYVVLDGIFNSVADTVSPSGVIAVVKKPIEKKVSGDIILLLNGIADSGNLGTIFRTCAARGIKDVICMDCCDAFSPKTIRASMGGIFYTNVCECSSDKVFNYLTGYDIISLDMNGESIYSYKRDGKIAIAVGSEAHGVAPNIIKQSKKIVCIPMEDGAVESLNAAVATGIAIYIIK